MNQRQKKFMPSSRLGRTIVGILLIIGGLLGALPVLGFWMIPLGFVILSVDSPSIRRVRRRVEVKLGRWWLERKARRTKRRTDKGLQ